MHPAAFNLSNAMMNERIADKRRGPSRTGPVPRDGAEWTVEDTGSGRGAPPSRHVRRRR